MRYDVNLIDQICREIGLSANIVSGQRAEVDLGRGTVLYFQNADEENDCLMGFSDMPWHAHGDLMFADPRGYYVNLDYLSLLTGLKEGKVLIAEREEGGAVVDRWLTHAEYNDEFRYLSGNERIIVRRATPHSEAEPGGRVSEA